MKNESFDGKSKNESHPFVKLKGSDIRGNTSKFHNIPGKPDIVVRKSFVNVESGGEGEKSIHEKAEFLKQRINEFKKIVDGLGIHMAKTDYIIGKDPAENKPVIFGVTDRIKGESLYDMNLLDKDLAEKIDDLYAKIISSCVDSFLKNGYFWYDPNSSQFMFGKAPGDEKPDIYLVDVDPNIRKWDDPEYLEICNETKEEVFWGKMRTIKMEICDLEKKVIEPGFKFTKVSEALDRAKKEVPL